MSSEGQSNVNVTSGLNMHNTCNEIIITVKMWFIMITCHQYDAMRRHAEEITTNAQAACQTYLHNQYPDSFNKSICYCIYGMSHMVVAVPVCVRPEAEDPDLAAISLSTIVLAYWSRPAKSRGQPFLSSNGKRYVRAPRLSSIYVTAPINGQSITLVWSWKKLICTISLQYKKLRD